MGVGYLAVGFVGTLASWFLLSKVGRRRIYIYGIAVLTIMMFLIGFLDCAPHYSERPGIIWTQSVFMIICTSYLHAKIVVFCTRPLELGVVLGAET